jgi:hypothetical protein
LPLVYSAEHVLCDGIIGHLLSTATTIIHHRAAATTKLEWVEVERVDLTPLTLSSQVAVSLFNRQVDAPSGRVVVMEFVDGKRHATQAGQFVELARLLSGPRKSVASTEQVVEALYGKSTENAKEGTSEVADNDHQQSLSLQTYPADFTPLSQDQINELMEKFKDDSLESQEIDFVIQLPVTALFETLFMDPQGRLFRTLHERLQNTQFKITSPSQTDSLIERTISYMHPLNNPIIKAKETQCVETMSIHTASAHSLYIIDVSASTPDILYGDAFVTRSRFALSFKTRASCRVQAWFGMRWSRSVLVKSIIRATARSGFAEYAKGLRQVVREEAARMMRRPSDGVTGDDAIDDGESSVVDSASASNSGKRSFPFCFSDYTPAITLLCVFLLSLLVLVRRNYPPDTHQVMAITMPGFTPPLLVNLDGIVEQARRVERALVERHYVKYLYEYLMECHEHSGAREHCQQALTEWQKIMRRVDDSTVHE